MSRKCAKWWGKHEEKGCWCGGRVTRISSFVVKLSSSGDLTDALPVPHNQGQAQSRPWPSLRLGTRSPRLQEAGASQEASQAAPRPVPKNLHGLPASFYPTSSFLSKKNRDRLTWGGGEGREHDFGRSQPAGLPQVPRVRAQRRGQVEG